MKTSKIKFLIFFVAALSVLTGCQQDFVNSKATFWPDIKINGDEIVIVTFGDTYTDAGATVTVNGAPVPYETVSDVDDSELGAYTVVYSAANEDGITASATRTVIVADPSALANDLTGTYQRSSNTPVSVWTKVADYTYVANNPGGVNNNPPFNVEFTIYNVADGVVVVPLQQVGGLAPFYGTSGSVGGSPLIPFNTAAAVGDVAYSWYLNGPNFGPSVRTFKKL
jgi:hypothetical protein